MSLTSLVRLAISEARAAGNHRRWMRMVSQIVDAVVVGTQPGIVYEIRFPVGLVTTNSTQPLPAGAVVTYASLDVLTGYSVGTTITLGTAAGPTIFMAAGENNAEVIGLYEKTQATFGAAVVGPVRATVAGGPVVGEARALVQYSLPLA